MKNTKNISHYRKISQINNKNKSLKYRLLKENNFYNLAIVLPVLTTILVIIAGLKKTMHFINYGISFKLLEFNIFDNFVSLCLSFLMIFIISSPFLIKTQFRDKSGKIIVDEVLLSIIMIIPLIFLTFILLYVTTKPYRLPYDSLYGIEQIKLLYFIFSLLSYLAIFRISILFKYFSEIHFKIQFNNYSKIKLWFDISCLILSIILAYVTINIAITNLFRDNIPDGTTFDIVNFENQDYAVIAIYKEKLIISSYYSINQFPSLKDEYSEYDTVINPFKYKVINMDNLVYSKEDFKRFVIVREKEIEIK